MLCTIRIIDAEGIEQFAIIRLFTEASELASFAADYTVPLTMLEAAKAVVFNMDLDFTVSREELDGLRAILEGIDTTKYDDRGTDKYDDMGTYHFPMDGTHKEAHHFPLDGLNNIAGTWKKIPAGSAANRLPQTDDGEEQLRKLLDIYGQTSYYDYMDGLDKSPTSTLQEYCLHDWKVYTGFNDSYRYCSICDKKAVES